MDSTQAFERYSFYFDKDPFPKIPAALLNSAEISNYIRTIGMVCPFDEKQLNGITLSLRIGDTGLYWDGDKKKIRKDINIDKEFVLKSNTIAYVSIAEELRLPQYIIARFNLRVTNAYRGILLGTGPIVDPGFQGKLFIPLHNLTNNEYVFYPGEDFIEMEFTKLNHIDKWDLPANIPPNIPAVKDGEYVVWAPKSEPNANTADRPIDHYLRKANGGRSINSSLPSLKSDTKEAIDKAIKTSEKVDTSLSRINVGLLFSFGALLSAIIAIVAIFRTDLKEIRDKHLEEKINNLELQHKQDSVSFKLLETKLKDKGVIK